MGPNVSFEPLQEWMRGWVGESLSYAVTLGLVVVGTTLLAALANILARRVIVVGIRLVVEKSRTQWDDLLVKHRVFMRASHLAPAVVLAWCVPFFPAGSAQQAIERLVQGYMIVVGMLVIGAVLNAVVDIYRTFDRARSNPIKGFVQGAMVLVYLMGGIFLVAALTGRDPWGMVKGVGAVTAVLMLVFKDLLLGLVATIQINANDLVHIGDWIEMPKYGADGDVIDVSLTTVKIQNWDKTITTVPTYALLTDSVKNWRGMQQSGGRRIKRAVHIDMNSIRFCTDEMVDRFEKIALLSDYIRGKRDELATGGEHAETDPSVMVNRRRLTNVGTLRAYILAYLKAHREIHSGMTFLVRQLAPSENGLPIEIYVFTSDTAWVNYENIQADIFDHILAAIPEFDLRVFQHPTGRDFQALASA